MPSTNILPTLETSEDGVYQVFCLCYAKLKERRARENFAFYDVHDGPMPLDYNVWIVRNSHRTVLVDTGFGARAAAERGRALDIDPLDALGRLGIDPELIEDVILTHLHYDHAGNLGRFTHARFHVQDAEVAFATGRCMCEPQLRFAFDVEDVSVLVRRIYADRVRFHDGDAAPLPGITLHLLPGHSKGVQAVRVMTPRGPVVLASDVTHYYANVLRRAPFVLTVDAPATLQSYEKLRALAGDVGCLIPGHDPKIRAIFPTDTFNGVTLTALHERPKPGAIEELLRTAGYP
jgi:glyoxylase-like metal-dependent hydrolase (beta-lactamase superfamily II)